MKYQKKDLEAFSHQIQFAKSHFSIPDLDKDSIKNIVIGGLGGSGIAAHLVKGYFYHGATLPVEVVSEYSMPDYVGKDTLAVLSSYSGNTEETLDMYADAKAKGAQIIVLTTGGKIGDQAEKDGYTTYPAEPGYQPRMALGYSFTYLLLLFGWLFNKDVQGEIDAVQSEVANSDIFIDRARNLFEKFQERKHQKFVVVADRLMMPVGLRFTQQLQENAKHEGFVHPLPETNHNVIESYTGKMDSIFIFTNSGESERTNLRFKFLKSLLEDKGNEVFSIDIEGTDLASMVRTIFTLDWLSLILADAKGVVSKDIPNINALKDYLANN